MKKILFLLIASGIASCVFGQAPQKVNYQAVCRDNSGNIISGQPVNLRITIQNLAPGGAPLYQETHATATNAYGLVNLALGGGIVQSGNFSIINWGMGDKYIQIELDNGSGYNIIGTPQLLSVPYALYANQSGASCLSLQEAYDGCSGSGSGRIINTFSSATPVEVNSNTAASIAFKSTHSLSGVAISAVSSSPATEFPSIQANTASNFGTIGGTPPPTAAILGNSSARAYAVAGQVEAAGSAEAAIYGSNLRTAGGMGVKGVGYNGTVGESVYSDGFATSGWNSSTASPGVGTFGQGVTGIAGQSTNLALSYGVYSYDDAGFFGSLDVGANIWAGGTKSFRIDHPADPENKFLVHFSVESPEILNLYRGNTILNQSGEATVSLPDYFLSVNTNFSYHLTPIGAPAANLHIKEKISGNQFTISGGQPGSEVSWVVYAERNDEYLRQNPGHRNPEPLKTGKYANKYVFPEGFGFSKEKSLLYLPLPEMREAGNNNSAGQPALQLFKQ